jgi:hypothetical protein
MQDQTQQKEWRKIINIEDITLDSTLNALEVNIPTLAKKLNVTRQCCWHWGKNEIPLGRKYQIREMIWEKLEDARES